MTTVARTTVQYCSNHTTEVFSCGSRCAGRLQWDHLRLRTDVLREDTHHGGERLAQAGIPLIF